MFFFCESVLQFTKKQFQVVFKVKCGDTDRYCMSGFTVGMPDNGKGDSLNGS